jgi:hypothetical protein
VKRSPTLGSFLHQNPYTLRLTARHVHKRPDTSVRVRVKQLVRLSVRNDFTLPHDDDPVS